MGYTERTMKQTILQGDCLEIMRTFPDKSFDLVLTDPPYGMQFRSNYRTIKHEKIVGDERFPIELITEFKRVARNAVYVFCRWNNLVALPPPKSVLVWVKNNWSMGDLKHEHGRQWEAIAFYPQEEHEFIKRIPDVIYADKTGNDLHPTQKPVELLKTILSANRGISILDPFMGSGSTLVAAEELGLEATGIEISEKYCAIAQERLDSLTVPIFV